MKTEKMNFSTQMHRVDDRRSRQWFLKGFGSAALVTWPHGRLQVLKEQGIFILKGNYQKLTNSFHDNLAQDKSDVIARQRYFQVIS